MYVTRNSMGDLPETMTSAIDRAAGFIDGWPAWAKAALLVVGVFGLVRKS